MATTTAAFSHLIAPGLRKVFFDRLKKWDEEYSKITTVLTSKRAYEEELTTAGLGVFQRKNQGTPVIYDDPTEGEVKRYTHVAMALGFRVTREMWDDDLYAVMRKVSSSLAYAAQQTVEMEYGGFLDDVFTGATYVGADTKALCARDHALVAGGTYANEPAVQGDLGIGTLRAAMERMERVVNERGLPRRMQLKRLIITPTYQWIAEEIIGSSHKPYTADNEINVMGNKGLSFMVSHYMSDDDMWIALADKEEADLKFFWKQRPIFDNADDFDTKDAKFTGYMRFSFGFTDWRGADGSSGG